MRIRLSCCLLLALSCAKRINPDPGADRTTYSGVWIRFGEAQPVPEGVQVLWDFGDGTAQGQGVSVTHAFPRAGVYTVVETIRDKDGQSRTARTHVTALKRTVQMAVPGDVRAVLLVPSPWQRMAVHRESADRLSVGALLDEMARAVGAGAGFDVLDGAAAAAHGFDPDEGVALFTTPQDPEALVFAIGTSDDALSLAVARRLLTSEQAVGRYGGGAFQLGDGQLPDGSPMLLGKNAAGESVGVLQHQGYLYLRLAGPSDPALALRSVAALPPDKGLSVDPGFVAAARHVGLGEAVFYSRGPDRAATGNGRLASELGSSAFAVYDKPDNHEFVQVRMFAQLKNLSGDALVSAFKPLLPPPDLARRLPADAAAYLRISAAPQALWEQMTRSGASDATRLHDRIQKSTGLDLEKDLIPSFSGNLGIGIYLDASSLIEALLGEEVGSFDRSAFVVVAQLTSPKTVQAALERAMRGRAPSDRATVSGASWFRLGDGAQAAVRDDVLYLALGGAPKAKSPPPPARTRGKKAKKKAPAPPAKEDLGILGRILAGEGPSLGDHFKRIGVAGFDVPGQQNAWVDIAGIVRSIERAARAQGGMVGQGARLFAERASHLRDALFEARPGGEGVDADLWIRFLPAKKSAAR
ncbi:MAG TPA: PKD domain-containing protein [Myxococcales bacterium]|nr:PKD domain-containing protein [Myxococcales bacterium]